MSGSIVVKITKDKIPLLVTCPICKKDLTPKILESLGWKDKHKFLPTNQRLLEDFNKSNINWFTVSCCWMTIHYKIIDKDKKDKGGLRHV